ncbi:2199_t:CDS:1, partial [Gigaspora rosea]
SNRIQWNNLAISSSTNMINKQNENLLQNTYNSTITTIENVIHKAGNKPSKSTNSALGEDIKMKKTGGRKSKTKSASVSELSIIKNQLIPESSEILNI